MAHHTLIARINAGNGKFPFVNVQFSKNHRPIPIKGATYYLRPSNCGKRTPIRLGKDVAVAPQPPMAVEDCVRGFRFLSDLTPEERTLASDPHQREQALRDRLAAVR